MTAKRDKKKSVVADRRDFPRLEASFNVRFGVCGRQGQEVPGFTNNVSFGGISFTCADTNATEGDHLAVEVTVPGFDEPLYFLGTVIRIARKESSVEIGCRFDWLGKSDRYKEKLQAFLAAHNLS